jgi:hypothetical protein
MSSEEIVLVVLECEKPPYFLSSIHSVLGRVFVEVQKLGKWELFRFTSGRFLSEKRMVESL